MLMRESMTMRKDFHSVCAAMAVIVTSAMLPMALMPAHANADDAVCIEEGGSASPDKDGNAVYHLLPDCTLHIGKGTIASPSPAAAPVKQHDSVKSIIIDDPAKTRFPDDASNMFSWYPNVESMTGLEGVDASHTTNFTGMFKGLLKLKTTVNLSSWDTSSATSLSMMFMDTNLGMFKGYEGFRLDGASLDLSNMFNSSKTGGSIDLSAWSIGAHTVISSMDGMFSGTVAEEISIKGDLAEKGAQSNEFMLSGTNAGIEGFGDLNMSNSKNARQMFAKAKLSGRMDLSSWDMSSVSDADQMFSEFNASDDMNVSSWSMPLITSTQYMFSKAAVDRIVGLDTWSLPNVKDSRFMYDNIQPARPFRIVENMRSVSDATFMFEGADLTKAENLANLRLSSKLKTSIWMFRWAKVNYLDMSKWGFHAEDDSRMDGMLGSSTIKYIKFGSMFEYAPEKLNQSLFYGGSSGAPNPVWSELPAHSYTGHWSRLPYNDTEGRFDGTLESLGSDDSWIDQSMFWESPDTETGADDDLQDIAYDEGSIIFREVTRPVGFHENTTSPVTGMPTMTASTWASTIDGDRVPCKAVPTDSTGGGRFREWNTKPDGTGIAYQPCDQLDHGMDAMNLYAQWDRTKKVHVRYHDTSGQATGMPGNAELHPGDHYTIPSQAPTRPGYRFRGWANEENGKPYYQPGDTITISGDIDAIDLYPVWEPAGTGVLPSAGLPAKAVPIIAAAGALLLIPISVFMIRRHGRIRP